MISNIADMSSKCLFAKYRKKVSELVNSEATLIFQLMLCIFIGSLDSLLEPIISISLNRLLSDVKNEFFQVRILGVILASFYNNCQLAMSILARAMFNDTQTYLSYSLQRITALSKSFTHPYDKKIAVLGLTSILTQLSMPEEVSSQLSVIFQVLIDILSETTKPKKPKNKKKQLEVTKTQGTTISIKGASNKYKYTDELQANFALKLFLNPIKEIDECTHFKDIIKGFQANNPGLLRYLVGSLNSIQVEMLQKVLMSKRVVISGDNVTEIRRIVKPKTRQIN